MKSSSIIYLTDCSDSNALARLNARIAALTGQTAAILPIVGGDHEASTGLTLLDAILSTERLGVPGHAATLLFNVAPRDGAWPNGVPFCYFWYNAHLIVGTFNPSVLSLLAANLGIDEVLVTDIAEVIAAAREDWADFSDSDAAMISGTQFRSLWYLPLLATWLREGRSVPSNSRKINKTSSGTSSSAIVAVVDNFGNCKTNQSTADLHLKAGEHRQVLMYDDSGVIGNISVPFYAHLVDVPQGQPGLIPGSSGYDFVELVIRGGSAALSFGLREGMPLFVSPAPADVTKRMGLAAHA